MHATRLATNGIADKTLGPWGKLRRGWLGLGGGRPIGNPCRTLSRVTGVHHKQMQSA